MHPTTQTIPQGLCLEAILIVWDVKKYTYVYFMYTLSILYVYFKYVYFMYTLSILYVYFSLKKKTCKET